jgi:hypothetical protein
LVSNFSSLAVCVPLGVEAGEVQELTPEELKFVAGGSLTENALKLMGEVLSNVSKAHSEIGMTSARNARA